MPEGFTLDKDTVRRVFDAVRRIEAIPRSTIQPLIGQVFPPAGKTWIQAQITQWRPYGPTQRRWLYGWRQISISNTYDLQVVPGGLAGVLDENPVLDVNPAFNLKELTNVDVNTGVQGTSVDESEQGYADSAFELKPIGAGAASGGTIGVPANMVAVRVFLLGAPPTPPPPGTAPYPRHYIDVVNAHDGSC